jgi:hypothetical protein
LKSRFFPAKTTLTFLKIDPSFTTLGFINIAALEFIYKARKKKWEFPDVPTYTSLKTNQIPLKINLTCTD